jgi:hypothetical protein
MQRPCLTLSLDLNGVGNTAAARYSALVTLCEYLSRGQLSTADLQPQAFYQRLQALKTYAAAMLGNAAVPNDETLRLTLFNAVPHAATERVDEKHGLTNDMATPELVRFMERQMRHSSR